MKLALILTVVALTIWNLTRTSIPSDVLLGAGIGFTALMLVIGVLGGLGPGDLGLERSRVPSGIAHGALVIALVIGVMSIASLLPFTSGHLVDARAEVGTRQMLFRVLVEIPVGTVLLEEVAFRGTLLGLLRRSVSPLVAVVISSVSFGLWHVDSVIRQSHPNWLAATGATLGTFVVTTLAGIGFAWLRTRSGSLVAPIGAHIATNSVTFAAAWALAR